MNINIISKVNLNWGINKWMKKLLKLLYLCYWIISIELRREINSDQKLRGLVLVIRIRIKRKKGKKLRSMMRRSIRIRIRKGKRSKGKWLKRVKRKMMSLNLKNLRVWISMKKDALLLLKCLWIWKSFWWLRLFKRFSKAQLSDKFLESNLQLWWIKKSKTNKFIISKQRVSILASSRIWTSLTKTKFQVTTFMQSHKSLV